MAAATEGLLGAAAASDNPLAVSFALNGFGYAYRDTDPIAAHEALRRGVGIAQDSGNRNIQSQLAVNLSRLAATHGDPDEAFDYITLAIRNYHDSGNYSLLPSPMAILTALFDRLGHHEPAATISGVAATPFTRIGYGEIDTAVGHLREVLGDDRYESLAGAGTGMSNADLVSYALDQIDQARTELNAVSK